MSLSLVANYSSDEEEAQEAKTSHKTENLKAAKEDSSEEDNDDEDNDNEDNDNEEEENDNEEEEVVELFQLKRARQTYQNSSKPKHFKLSASLASNDELPIGPSLPPTSESVSYQSTPSLPHPSLQYAVKYDEYNNSMGYYYTESPDASNSNEQHSHHNDNNQLPEELLSHSERMQLRSALDTVQVSQVRQADILAAGDIESGQQPETIRKLKNSEFVGRNNGLIRLLGIAKQRESVHEETMKANKKNRYESAARYGW